MADDFDYGQLTKDWWHETGKTIGASERAIKFSAAKFRGASNTVAAREAGYGGNNESGARTEGYRLYRSNKVTQLLQRQRPVAESTAPFSRRKPNKSSVTWLAALTHPCASRP